MSTAFHADPVIPVDPLRITIDDADGPLEHPDKVLFAANVTSSTSPRLQTSAPVVSFARQAAKLMVHVKPSVFDERVTITLPTLSSASRLAST